MNKPEGLTEEHLEFLDDLRESGLTNMFGAVPYLTDTFFLTKLEAKEYLKYWMATFEERHDES